MVDNVLYTRKERSMEIPIVVVEVEFYNESYDKLKENVREIMKLDRASAMRRRVEECGSRRVLDMAESSEDTIFKDVPDLPTNIWDVYKFPLGCCGVCKLCRLHA
ncbi:hypothetical protein SELMODRAFT_419860 [Selaginella moellendorffii]|uniref:Uncharacterized protein n=1 Tax=Selaginella moellendorffii TaxID=88036 RepID=D8SAS2_SELML|nr:hypothetical protein SELMODRAFT_419860 [Selaginella moellendorffii]